MKLVIFGSTGSVGRHIVEQALAQGHTVTAFARRPEALTIKHPNLSLVAGDVFDPMSVSGAIKGQDGVLSALGSPKLTGTLRSTGTGHIVNAMAEHGVKRLICLSTLGVGSSRANLNFLWKYLMFGLLLRSVYNDHIRQEKIVKNSDHDWTIVRPAAYTDDPATDYYKHGFGANEKNLTLKISRIDVADFMLRQIDDNRYLHQTPGLSC